MLHNSSLCGLDEVGRGALAGPLVACGVILHCSPSQLLKHLPFPPRDSKQLSTHQRQTIVEILTTQHSLVTTQISAISVSDINTHGIAWANRQVFLNIVQKLNATRYLIDGNLRFPIPTSPTDSTHPPHRIASLPHADSSILQVQLASIIAKVHRDHLMHQLHLQYPHFNWLNNVGYGTRQHLQALAKHGPSKHHRTLFTTTALNNWKNKTLSPGF